MKLTSAQKSDLKSYLINKMKSGRQDRNVEIRTPYPLNSNDLKFFEKYLEIDSKNISNPIDKELLGGFVLTDGSNRLDASLKGSLDSIVSSLYSN